MERQVTEIQLSEAILAAERCQQEVERLGAARIKTMQRNGASSTRAQLRRGHWSKPGFCSAGLEYSKSMAAASFDLLDVL